MEEGKCGRPPNIAQPIWAGVEKGGILFGDGAPAHNGILYGKYLLCVGCVVTRLG